MTLAEIKTMLSSITGYSDKVVYRAWRVGEAPDLPFICYLETGSDNFAADGIAYHKIKRIDIELYTETKSPADEALVESALDTAGLYWESDETYIDDEKMYEKVYTIEV